MVSYFTDHGTNTVTYGALTFTTQNPKTDNAQRNWADCGLLCNWIITRQTAKDNS